MSKQGKQDRRARVEAMRAEQARKDRRWRWLIVGGTVAVLVVVGSATTWAINASNKSTPSATIPGLQTYSGLSRNHVQGNVTYPQTPPVGGDHSAVWQNCGIYKTPVANVNAVHSMEHGAMWITYQPNLPQSQIDALKAALARQPYALVSPYAGLPSPVVASVWGAQLHLASATDPRLQTFISTYQSGSQAPEPGGKCTGGKGNPTG